MTIYTSSTFHFGTAISKGGEKEDWAVHIPIVGKQTDSKPSKYRIDFNHLLGTLMNKIKY